MIGVEQVTHLRADLVDRSERDCLLDVEPGPDGDLIAEPVGDARFIHGELLDRVQHVQPQVDQPGQQLLDVAAAVQPEMHAAPVGRVDQFGIVGGEERVEHFGREERPRLRAEVVGDVDGVGPAFVPGAFDDAEVEIRQRPEQPVDLVRVDVVVHESVRHSPQRPVPLKQGVPPVCDAVPAVVGRDVREESRIVGIGERGQHVIEHVPIGQWRPGIDCLSRGVLRLVGGHPPVLRIVLRRLVHLHVSPPDELGVLRIGRQEGLHGRAVVRVGEGAGVDPLVQQHGNPPRTAASLDHADQFFARQGVVGGWDRLCHRLSFHFAPAVTVPGSDLVTR